MFWLHAKEPNWMNTLLAITYGRHCDLSILLCMQGCRHMSSVRYFSYALGVNGIGEELLMAEHHSLGRIAPLTYVLTPVRMRKTRRSTLYGLSGARRNVGLVPELPSEYRSGYCETPMGDA
jgi:hypothetical protein